MNIPESKMPHALQEWEYRLIIDHADKLTVQQLASTLGRHWQTIYKAGKKLKLRFMTSYFQWQEPELPNVEEYKILYSKPATGNKCHPDAGKYYCSLTGEWRCIICNKSVK